jgi:3-dehydroquinate dehydratase type I
VTSRICVSILPKTVTEAVSLIEGAEKASADFVEVRLDFLDSKAKLSDIVKSTKIPLIATNKFVNEKGNFTGSETERNASLVNAAKAGVQFVDINLSNANLKAQVKEIKQLGAKAIVSHHDFEGPIKQAEMKDILEKQISYGASVCKIVSTAKQTQDNLDVLNFVSENAPKTPLVCFCMGEQGKISRLLSPVYGAYFTFAALEKGSQTAPGQLSIKEMRDAYILLGTN